MCRLRADRGHYTKRQKLYAKFLGQAVSFRQRRLNEAAGAGAAAAVVGTGANIGMLSVLHTWGQNLQHHPHVHCVVPGGGLALDGFRWVMASPRFLLPVPVLSRVFRGKFIAGLKLLLSQGKLRFHGSLEELQDAERFYRFLRELYTNQ